MKRFVLVVGLAGCVHHFEAVGGTPGQIAVRCAAGDAVCERVAGALELRRHDIGGWCGTTTATAELELQQVGLLGLPYLVQAFDDVDTEVASLALRTVAELGGGRRVLRWCAGLHDLERIDMCRDALERGLAPRS